MPPKGKRVQVKQPASSDGKDGASKGGSAKRSKGNEVREKDTSGSGNGSVATIRKNPPSKTSSASSGSKSSTKGSTVSTVRRDHDALSTASKNNRVAIATNGTAKTAHAGRSAPSAIPPVCSSLYQQRTPTSISTGRNSVNSMLENVSPLAVPANVIQSGGRQGVDESSLVTENNSVLYNHELWDSKKENEYRMSQLKEYVRNDLFPAWKFFSSKKQMVFSNKPGGIVLKICNDLKVHNDHLMYWWDTHKKNILDALNRKRNDVTSYLKKRFCGKCNLLCPQNGVLL